MFASFLISFREYLEVFLIVGVFVGIDQKLSLGKTRNIVITSIIGILLSLVLPMLTFYVSDISKSIITAQSASVLEGYLMVFSGVFLAYIVISLHRYFKRLRGREILLLHERMGTHTFSYTLYATILFFILREGFEIALFTTSTSLFSTFVQNMFGLLGGFVLAAVCGICVTRAYVRISLQRVMVTTEYLIIMLGAALVKNGVAELAESQLGTSLSTMGSLPLGFLPDTSTFAGSLLKSLTGLEPQFSYAMMLIMFIYTMYVYWLGMKKTPTFTS